MIFVYHKESELQSQSIQMEKEGYEIVDVTVSRRLTYSLANSQTVCCPYHELVWTVLYKKKSQI
jgi:hypothetical protein